MVLSPIEPVAPSTVTLRTSSVAALLLRNGTGFILSPNHKTAANAIGTVSHKSENRRQHKHGHQAVEPVHQPAMAGDDVAGIFHPEPAFHSGFKEIAELSRDREEPAEDKQRNHPSDPGAGKARRHDEASEKAAHRAGPGLVRTDARPEFR